MKMEKKVSVGAFAKVLEDFKDQDLLEITDAGKEVEGKFGMQMVFKVKLPNGEEKNLSFNQTTINILIDKLGEESDVWVGKKVKVWAIRQAVQGKLTTVVYLTPPDSML